MRRRFTFFHVSLAITLAFGMTSGCASKNAFKPGQKLSGRYNSIVMGSSESYLFREDGTFEHTGFGKDGKGSESGTYSIDGKNVTFNANGKSVTTNISASKGDSDKLNPAGLYIDVESYELSNNPPKTASQPASKDSSVPVEYEKFALAKVGAFNRNKVAPYRANAKDRYREGMRFIYDSNNYLDIKKYSSEAEAQADYKKRVSAAVASDEYSRKVKLPKCDPNKETDYETPEVLIKRLSLKSGGEAVVLQSSKFWDYACKLTSNREEYVLWTDGVYLFEISSSPPDIHSDAFGKAEAFFNQYQKTTGQ